MELIEGFPRRSKLYENTPEELMIYNAIQEIEKLGADPLLTDCVNKLSEARNKLADWVEKEK